MSFQFSAQHIEEYNANGYTIFRGIVPESLMKALRRECDLAAQKVRAQSGNADAQRVEPLADFVEDSRPFRDFENLPAIREAVSGVLGSPNFVLLGLLSTVLIEPTENAWCTSWHRDWRDNIPGTDIRAWNAQFQNRAIFNQVNCALYEDDCAWVVPGSHLRLDSEEERTLFPERPIPDPPKNNCAEYSRSMPNATRLILQAGDYCLYRNTLWHMGSYVPGRKRATLHSNVMTPEFLQWWMTAPQIAAARRAAGIEWENPNGAKFSS